MIYIRQAKIKPCQILSAMLRYSRQLLCPFADEVISLASLGTIVEKCSLNAFDISDGVVIEISFTISSFTEEVLVLQDVS